ncbi:Acyltransferase [Vibrio chagasii]|nr:Acyltransferase [Vibrio chagasii]
MKFRKDINTLRALAVLSVVAYHFMPNIIKGGFIGVDVFFVISGYLMTKIIMGKLARSEFSFLEFYSARCNRIIPPLAFLCLVLLIFGYYNLTLIDFRTLSKHIISSVLFISNYNYYMEAGYFDINSNLKWLLHTWSLSVEWQFYLIFPVFLIVLNKLSSGKLFRISYLIAFMLAVFYAVYLYENNRSLAFYGLQSRFWELMIGGLAYLFPLNTSSIKVRRNVSYVGYLVLILSLLTINSELIWPSGFVFYPVLGTYLIIIANYSGCLENNKIIQGIGMRSYSIYLWHWPIKTLFFYSQINNYYFLLLGIFISFIAGSIAFSLIERKTWNSSKLLSLHILKAYTPLLYIALLLVLSGYSYITNGMQNRTYVNNILDIAKSPYHTSCDRVECNHLNREASWAVIGDSHSKEIAYSLAKILEDKKEGIVEYSFAGCSPSYKLDDGGRCSRWTSSAVNAIANNNEIKNVVISYRYEIFSNNKEKVESLSKIIKKLNENNKKVFVIAPIPFYPGKENINTLAFYNHIISNDEVSIVNGKRSDYDNKNKYIINILKSLEKENVDIVDVESTFCGEYDCFSIFNGVPLYFDDNHPSLKATDSIAKMVIEKSIN